MAFVAKNPFQMHAFNENTEQQVEYPAEFHFRIITEPANFEQAALEELLRSYQVTRGVEVSNASSSGRFQAYGVSIRFASKEEHAAFDRAAKALAGVRLVL